MFWGNMHGPLGLPSNIFSISAFLTNAIRLLNLDAFNLPLATSL